MSPKVPRAANPIDDASSRPREGARNRLTQATSLARRYLWAVAAISCFVNLLMLTVPVYMLQLYDRVLTSRNESTLLLLTLLALGLLAGLGALELVRSRALVRIGSWYDQVLRRDLAAAVLTGERGSQCVRDLDELRTFLAGPGLLALMDAPWTPLFIAAVFLLHPLLGVVCVGGVVVLAVLAVLNETGTRPVLDEAGRHAARAHRFADLASRNAEVIRAMSMDRALLDVWERERAAGAQLQAQASDRAGTITAVAKVARLTLQVIVLATGGWLAVRGVVSPGVMITASILSSRALAPIEMAIGSWRTVVGARQAYGRMQGAMASRNSNTPTPPMTLPKPRGDLDLERVTVRVEGRDKPLLFDVSVSLKAGQQLGITGPSAAGKSTLARAIVGVRDPTAGVVRLDGFSLSNWPAAQRGQAIGYLPQDVELFDGTVAQNISRFQPSAPEAVVAAARLAGVYEMIADLPNGFDTAIGVGGEVLSGGQRQRIALARAVFDEPALVVLDEPSASLDAPGTDSLVRALGRLRGVGVTVVLIAHRPSLLAHADQVLVLGEGHVQQLGTAAEVLPKITRSLGGSGTARVTAVSRPAARRAAPSRGADGKEPPP